MTTTNATSRHVVLFLAANPRAIGQVALDEECAAIERELRMTPTLDNLDFQPRWAVSAHAVAHHAHTLQPAIIHFSGDGSGGARRRTLITDRGYDDTEAALDAGICLQGEHTGHAQYVGVNVLAGLLSSAAPWANVIVLNRCFSDFVADSLLRGCVVGMDGAVSNEMSRSFAVLFYRALSNRHSIGNAVEQAIWRLVAKGLPDEHLPVCRTRDGDSANQIFLPDPSRPRW